MARWVANGKAGKHDGVDLVSDGDKTIIAAAAGKVVSSNSNGSWGEHIAIKIADGRTLVYAHMVKGSRKVFVGAVVSEGQPLGIMGSTGNSTGAHLHIELQKNYYTAGLVDDITEYLGIENNVGAIRFIQNQNEFNDLKIILPDGKTITVKAIVDNGTNYVALREVIEALGYKVGWKSPSVTISK